MPKPQPTGWQRLPFTVRYVVPALVTLTAAYGGWRWWTGAHVALVFAAEGVTMPDELRLTFYPDHYSFALPSPAPVIGAATVRPAEGVTLGEDLVPQRALLRYEGNGIGTGYAHVELGRIADPIFLQPPSRLAGRVVQKNGGAPVADATVIAMGGGQLGVPVAETRTGPGGEFELQGFDGSIHTLGLRVLKNGFAALNQDHQDSEEELVLRVERTDPVRGQVLLPPGIDPARITVLARGVPGAHATPDIGGAFTLETVPKGPEPRLLVHGLPPGFTQPLVRAAAGTIDVVIPVVRSATARGTVLDGLTNLPLHRARVYHMHGPQGMVLVETDLNGTFVIGDLPPGEVILEAEYETRGVTASERIRRTGQRQVVIAEGVEHPDCSIRID